MSSEHMPGYTESGALVLYNAVVDSDAWEPRSVIANGDLVDTNLVRVDGEDIPREDMPDVLLTRLGAMTTDPEDDSVFTLSLARKTRHHYSEFLDFADAALESGKEDEGGMYTTIGVDVATVTVGRIADEAYIHASYRVHAIETELPVEPIFCGVSLALIDDLKTVQAIVRLAASATVEDLQAALGVDPLTGKQDPTHLTADSLQAVQQELAGKNLEALSAEELHEMAVGAEAANLLADLQVELSPLTGEEVMAVAALVRNYAKPTYR